VAAHKRRLQSEGFVQCRHFADNRVSSDADVCTLLSQCGQGSGVNFSQFCADIFYGRPLIGWSDYLHWVHNGNAKIAWQKSKCYANNSKYCTQ